MYKEPIFLAGFPILETNKIELSNYICKRMASMKKSVLFFANTNFIVQCRPILQRMINDDVLIVNDGIGIDLASLLLHRRKFEENLNGTDFTPYFLNKTNASLRIFLLGSKPEVLAKATNYLQNQLGQSVVGTCDGYTGIQRANLVNEINTLNVDIVLVAMGNPKQELWILDHYQQLNVKLITGVGALFDFWAGDKSRAPIFIQRIRMEWFYRLCLEPKRLLKRYTIDVMVFLILCIKHRKSNVKT